MVSVSAGLFSQGVREGNHFIALFLDFMWISAFLILCVPVLVLWKHHSAAGSPSQDRVSTRLSLLAPSVAETAARHIALGHAGAVTWSSVCL